METELVVKLITDLRTDMNARFDRLEHRMDRRFEGVELRLTNVHLELLRETAALNARVTEEAIWGRRELRSRLDRCEREIEELKRKTP